MVRSCIATAIGGSAQDALDLGAMLFIVVVHILERAEHTVVRRAPGHPVEGFLVYAIDRSKERGPRLLQRLPDRLRRRKVGGRGGAARGSIAEPADHRGVVVFRIDDVLEDTADVPAASKPAIQVRWTKVTDDFEELLTASLDQRLHASEVCFEFAGHDLPAFILVGGSTSEATAWPRSDGLAGEYGHAPGAELRGIGFVFASRKDIHFVRHHRVHEARECERLPPLCLQQSTGNSAAPEVDVIARVLRNLLVDEDVANLHSSAGLEHTEHLAEDGRLVRAEVDDTVADDDVGGRVINGE